MAKARTTSWTELDFEDYLEARLAALDLDSTLADIHASLDDFERRSKIADSQTVTLGVASVIILIVLGGVYILNETFSLELIAWYSVLASLSALAMFTSFRRSKWTLYLAKTGLRPLVISEQPAIDAVLKKVDQGPDTIKRISLDGIGIETTPVEGSPVDLSIGKGCLADRRAVLEIFGSQGRRREFVVVVPEPTGEWFNFYLWHPPVAERLDEMFDKTPEIYADSLVKRIKVRIALIEIAKYVKERLAAGKPLGAKSLVVKRVAKELKLQATKLRAVEDINDLEEQQLCRINITGDALSSDPAETAGNRGKKPESWLFELMGGRYATVIKPLSETIQRETNVPLGFVSQ